MSESSSQETVARPRALATPPPRKRFAIGTFADEASAVAAADELGRGGIDSTALSLLGSMERWGGNGRSRMPFGAPHKMAFAEDQGPIVCTGTAVPALLSSASDAQSFAQSLRMWLLPVHARRLSDAVAKGHLLLWVEILSPEQECSTCLTLLRHSGRTVQTHDF